MSLNPMGFGDPAITEPPWIADPSLMGLGASQRSGPQGPAQSISFPVCSWGSVCDAVIKGQSGLQHSTTWRSIHWEYKAPLGNVFVSNICHETWGRQDTRMHKHSYVCIYMHAKEQTKCTHTKTDNFNVQTEKYTHWSERCRLPHLTRESSQYPLALAL